MSEERTYLELSEDEGAHKFYETTVKGKVLTIRFGRIGEDGQKKVTTFATPAAARAEAAKKIAEKTHKGYAPAVMGERERRPISRRGTSSAPSNAKPAPVLWRFETGACAFGIFIDDEHCWAGNEAKRVFCLDHDGKVLQQFKLPDSVMALVGDDRWLYAGCDDGNVYDLTGRVPRLAYSVEGVMVLWQDICDGVLAVSDMDAGLTVFDAEEELLWQKKGKGSGGWMVRSTPQAIYHGHGSVSAYQARDGKQLWQQKKPKDVLFGWQTGPAVYPGCGSGHVYKLGKKKGDVQLTCEVGDGVLSNATSPDDRFIFAGDSNSTIHCFDGKANRLWTLGTGCGSALSMQYHKEKLYIVTTDGTLACLDASEKAITAAQAGKLPKTRQLKAPKAVAAADVQKVETVTDAGSGVVVECYKEGQKLRVRVVSPGYEPSWHVQFPRNLREEGARFVVDDVLEATHGGYYRARGDVRRLGEGAGGKRKR